MESSKKESESHMFHKSSILATALAISATTIATADVVPISPWDMTLSTTSAVGNAGYSTYSGWTLSLYLDFDMTNATALNPAISGWQFEVTDTTKTVQYRAFGTGFVADTDAADGRALFIITLSSATVGPNWLTPPADQLKFEYSFPATTNPLLQAAIEGSAGDIEKGFLHIGSDAGATGDLSGSYSALVPSPGAAALAGLAGLMARRRRNA